MARLLAGADAAAGVAAAPAAPLLSAASSAGVVGALAAAAAASCAAAAPRRSRALGTVRGAGRSWLRRQAAEQQGEIGVVEEVAFFEGVDGDDPLIRGLEERLRTANGDPNLTLDMVLNPATIVNIEREVILLKAELKATPEDEVARRKELEDLIEKKQMKVVTEMRQVMTDSLKLEFLLQAVISVPIFASLCYGTFPFVPELGPYGVNPDYTLLALKLFGFWGVWLVTIPALRARKPGGPYGMGYEEKRALDTSFSVVPLGNILLPFLSRDPAVPFWWSLIVLGGCYAWSYNTPLAPDAEMGSRRGLGTRDTDELPEWAVWALKSLDFGTGSERGAVSEDREWKAQLEAYEKAAEALAAAKAAAKAGTDTAAPPAS